MMKKLLTDLERNYYLKLGDKSFSPIMQFSIGLAMKYQKELVGGQVKYPFHLNFPDKQQSALWLSVSLMRNFLLDDYINQPFNRVEELKIENGDNIEIYGTTAKLIRYYNNSIELKFRDQQFTIKNISKLQMHINKTIKQRINRFSLYNKNRRNLIENRNAISRLLEPKEPIIVNPEVLTSKILVIAGRGNTGVFTQRLKDEKIFEESLASVFGYGDNIIIKPDLEDFVFLGKEEDSTKEKRFKAKFLQFEDVLRQELPQYNNEVNTLSKIIRNNNFRTKDFIYLFDEILAECNKENIYHRIRDIYPGIKRELPKDLKSIIINDITQLETYGGVIDKILKKGIPVMIISNKYIEDRNTLSFFKDYFKTHSNDIRINWNKNKIQALSKLNFDGANILDNDLWNKCLKFSNQKIEVKTTDPHPIDSLLLDLQRGVSNVEGQERLISAYWRYFNPLIYSFKNSNSFESYHKILLDKFLDVYYEVNTAISNDLKINFDNIIKEMLSNKQSFKELYDQGVIFEQEINLGEEAVSFPAGDFTSITSEYISSSTSQITFPGFPLNEPINNYLVEAISEHIVSDITIVCWPQEGRLTYRYIFKRMVAGYYTDNLPSNWNFPNNLLLEQETDIKDTIDEILKHDFEAESDIKEDDIETEEDVLEKISNFKYTPYQSDSLTPSNATVKCNIIDLKGSQFMFLPKTSSVLAKLETEGDQYEFRKARFMDLNIGDELFQYELSRQRLRGISKAAEDNDKIFNTLELWRKSLHKSFKEENYDMIKLIERLKIVNHKRKLEASPSYPNLRNWLYDRDMLSPREKNLKMILMADSSSKMIDNFSDIYEAYKEARALSREVSLQIKKLIIKKLKSADTGDGNKFELQVFGYPIDIQFRRIKGLRKADIEVDYQYARKIIG